MDPFAITCAVNGVSPTEEELRSASEDGIPLGWTRVSFETAYPNPQKQMLRELKETLFKQRTAMIPKEVSPADRAYNKKIIRLDIDATYHAFSEATPEVLTNTEEIYLAPVHRFPNVTEALGKIQDALGVASRGVEPEPDEAA